MNDKEKRIEKTLLTRTCPICSLTASVEVLTSEFEAYKSGELLQNAFTTLLPAQREIVKTGIHPECWKDMFAWTEEEG